MQVKSIAECSLGAFCNTFELHLATNLSLRHLLCLFLSGQIRQVLLYLCHSVFACAWIIFYHGGQQSVYLFYTTYISVYLAHYEIFRAKLVSNGVAKTLKKLRTSRESTISSIGFLQLCPFSNWNFSQRKELAPRGGGGRILSFKSSS